MKCLSGFSENGRWVETTVESFSFDTKAERDFFISNQKCLKAVPWEIKKGPKGNKKTKFWACIHQKRTCEG
jgi:hypothetical protein